MVTVAFGFLVLAYALADTDSDETLGPAIETLIPAEGTEILAQARVGIDLAPGYDATLAVNGVPIPDDELIKAPALNLVEYQPGDGLIIEAWRGGRNCVLALFWRIQDGPGQSQARQWCFEAA